MKMIGEAEKDGVRSKIFQALGNPTRLKIVEALLTGDKSVSQIVEALGFEQSAVSHALKTLKGCGIVTSTNEGKRNIYTLRDPRIVEILAISDEILTDIAADLTKCVCD
jgi:DNA-binding transcriptional ArsR family regulator